MHTLTLRDEFLHVLRILGLVFQDILGDSPNVEDREPSLAVTDVVPLQVAYRQGVLRERERSNVYVNAAMSYTLSFRAVILVLESILIIGS